MFKNLYRFIIILALPVFLIACQKTELLSDIVFDNNLLQKININAESIEINNSYEYRISEPFIDHIMLITPSQRIESWLEDNVFIFGSLNKFVVNIEEASIIRNEIVNKDQTKKIIDNKEYYYEINILMNFILYDDADLILATTHVEVNHSTTSSKFISINEKNHILDSLTFEALRDTTTKSIELLKIHMSEYML